MRFDRRHQRRRSLAIEFGQTRNQFAQALRHVRLFASECIAQPFTDALQHGIAVDVIEMDIRSIQSSRHDQFQSGLFQLASSLNQYHGTMQSLPFGFATLPGMV